MEDHRLVDVIIAGSLVGISGSLVVVAFQRKLDELARRSNGALLIACIAGMLLLVAMALVLGQITDFVIPIPTPHLPSSTPQGYRTLIEAVIVGSLVVLWPLYIELVVRAPISRAWSGPGFVFTDRRL